MPNKKQKILHIIPRFEIGGAEMLVLHYVRLMNGEKYEIAVASCVEDGAFRSEFEKAGVKVFAGSRKNMGGRIGVWRELKKFVGEWQPDVVHTHLMASDFCGYLLSRKNKIKWISTQHNVEFNTSWPRRVLWRLILPAADQVIAVAQKVSDYVVNNFGVSQQKITTVLNGIIIDKWISISNSDLFRSDRLRLASVGRLYEQKGHIYLLRALASLKDVNWSYEVFGDGPLGEFLQAEAKRLGIADRITWHGAVTNLSEKIENIDIVIQPSLWEGLSLVIMEMMAAGRCVLATTEAGAELIDQTETGWLVKSGDSTVLADAIRHFYAHPELGQTLGQKAREYARVNFGIEKNIEKIEKLYAKFL